MAIHLAFTGPSGCASISAAQKQPATDPIVIVKIPDKPKTRAHRGLAIAHTMIGAPYHYGGSSPRGFDCSGLVYYAYRKAGIQVSRTTTEQYRQSKRVQISRLQPGDLVFFTISHDKLSHVGIYAGNGRFIHAPSGGNVVGYASIDDPYWRGRLTGTGRL